MEREGLTVTTVEPGLKVVHRPCPGATEFCGVTAAVGSRDELTPRSHGLAHFVEHTIFKGTSRRSDSYILNRMEAVGGELNAFTTKEETTVYSAMPAGNYARATALIGELVTGSVFPQKRIDLEREVIADEIDSYLDSPSEAVFDSFDEHMFAGSSMAHNILGTKESVAAITPAHCREFLQRHFTADNMVYFYLGPAPAAAVVRAAAKAFAAIPATASRTPRVTPEAAPPFSHVQPTDTHQSHTVMGAITGGLHSPHKTATALAVNILGGPGMNSMLNVALRERRGLVYTVEASTALYSDCGLMTIYYGCDHADAPLCRRLTMRALEQLASSPMSQRRLDAWKRQFTGQLTLSSDHKEQLAISTARALLHGLPAPHLETTRQRILDITPEQLRLTAESLAQAPLRTLTLQ